MRHFLLLAGLGLALAWGRANLPAAEPKPADDEATCHGTAVHFVNTPSEAARQAKTEEKLVFVLHVSGHFEDPGIT
jgi:hypothetical protein